MGSHPKQSDAPPGSAIERFKQSMHIDFDKWHDGEGYDLTIIESASAAERAAIEALLLSRPIEDWRDVEALAAIDSPRARSILREALRSGSHHIQIAVAQYAPALVSDTERTATLVAALESAEGDGALTQALLEIEHFHPPAVIDALFRGTLQRTDDYPVHLAAMLMFLHGKAESPFDWSQRPFFLRFRGDNRAERATVFAELCARLGVDARTYQSRS